MLSNENISDVLGAAGGSGSLSLRDIAFLVLCDTISDKEAIYRIVYEEPCSNAGSFISSDKMKSLAEALQPFGVGRKEYAGISREENQSELIKMLDEIKSAMEAGDMERGQGLKMMADIRVKLQDKFDMEESDNEQRHLIIVPQKHDLICPHTNRECTQMPSKEACIRYYGLSEL